LTKQNISAEWTTQNEGDFRKNSTPKSRLTPSADREYKSDPLYIPLSHLWKSCIYIWGNRQYKLKFEENYVQNLFTKSKINANASNLIGGAKMWRSMEDFAIAFFEAGGEM